MVAGTKYRGDFEERIQKAMDEVKQAGNIILFIDEVHTLMGAGSAEGATDAANILKPALARGEIQVIGATTIDEYRKHRSILPLTSKPYWLATGWTTNSSPYSNVHYAYSIRAGGTVTTRDNGVSQEVEARQGVSLKALVQVKPRVALRPFRTFLEVEQPVSEFLLRLDDDLSLIHI